jgi:hypothetical protein
VVVSLTALTAGLAPAVADPRPDPVVPTTPVVVAPETPVVAAEAPLESPKSVPAKGPEAPQAPVVPQIPEAPQTPVAPPVTVASPAPEIGAPAPPPRAPEPPSAAPAPQPEAPEPPEPRSTPKSAPPSVALAPAPSAASASPTPPTAVAPPSTSTDKPAPQSVPSSVERKPDTSVTQTSVDPTAELSTAPATVSSAPPSGEVTQPPTPGAPPASAAPVRVAPETPPADGAKSSTESSTPSTTGSSAARAIKTEAPQTLDAPEEDVQLAMNAKAVEEDPLPAPKDDVAAFASALKISDLPSDDRNDRTGNGPRDKDEVVLQGNQDNRDNRASGRDWDRKVKQWDPAWVQYDEYYRPVISNPYRQPVRIVYVYQNQPRIVLINPLARVVLNVAQYAAYSFTAVVVNAVDQAVNAVDQAVNVVDQAVNVVDQAVNVAVGSFFGGGYFPGFGLPLPPPPPPVLRYDNVPVQVRYSQATYEPFRVQRIVDVGPDAQYGERKILLDGVTPAWGEWTQSSTGERQFEIHKTQQFPGLEQPAEGQLPGDYRLQLASDESQAGMDAKTRYLVVVAGVLAALSLGAVLWSAMLGRRRNTIG